MIKDQHRLSRSDIEDLATPYYGPRFWDQLRQDMGQFSESGPYSPGAATNWKRNGMAGRARIAALKAIAARREYVLAEMKKSDRKLRLFLKTIEEE